MVLTLFQRVLKLALNSAVYFFVNALVLRCFFLVEMKSYNVLSQFSLIFYAYFFMVVELFDYPNNVSY